MTTRHTRGLRRAVEQDRKSRAVAVASVEKTFCVLPVTCVCSLVMDSSRSAQKHCYSLCVSNVAMRRKATCFDLLTSSVPHVLHRRLAVAACMHPQPVCVRLLIMGLHLCKECLHHPLTTSLVYICKQCSDCLFFHARLPLVTA